MHFPKAIHMFFYIYVVLMSEGHYIRILLCILDFRIQKYPQIEQDQIDILPNMLVYLLFCKTFILKAAIAIPEDNENCHHVQK